MQAPGREKARRWARDELGLPLSPAAIPSPRPSPSWSSGSGGTRGGRRDIEGDVCDEEKESAVVGTTDAAASEARRVREEKLAASKERARRFATEELGILEDDLDAGGEEDSTDRGSEGGSEVDLCQGDTEVEEDDDEEEEKEVSLIEPESDLSPRWKETPVRGGDGPRERRGRVLQRGVRNSDEEEESEEDWASCPGDALGANTGKISSGQDDGTMTEIGGDESSEIMLHDDDAEEGDWDYDNDNDSDEDEKENDLANGRRTTILATGGARPLSDFNGRMSDGRLQTRSDRSSYETAPGSVASRPEQEEDPHSPAEEEEDLHFLATVDGSNSILNGSKDDARGIMEGEEEGEGEMELDRGSDSNAVIKLNSETGGQKLSGDPSLSPVDRPLFGSSALSCKTHHTADAERYGFKCKLCRCVVGEEAAERAKALLSRALENEVCGDLYRAMGTCLDAIELCDEDRELHRTIARIGKHMGFLA